MELSCFLFHLDAGVDKEDKKKEVIIGVVTQIDLLHYISIVEEVVRKRYILIITRINFKSYA